MTDSNSPASPQLGTVLITGGASGLGAATVRAVLAHGGRPLVLDRVAPADGVPHRLVDLADSPATEQALTELVAEHGGRLDGVFTAAGIDSCGRLEDVPSKEWERVVFVNLLGTAAVARAALPLLEAAGGRLVTCASTLGIKAVSDATAYCASKFGVVGFTRALAAETAGRVGVTLLIPGGMETPFFDGRDEQYKPPADAKLNDPAHVAETVVFALTQPAGCELRELVVAASTESSWP
ncbi:MAG TPA: SDR family oxidoreductase [Microlunatus sp.]|jgi:NAD(P)-dependent dehydrogenase (short-subunit alcohol dehydrogenase family)|nr:SDR family oxidoreductase [Microlunatus sp.]